jgi:hypothetical protein
MRYPKDNREKSQEGFLSLRERVAVKTNVITSTKWHAIDLIKQQQSVCVLRKRRGEEQAEREQIVFLSIFTRIMGVPLFEQLSVYSCFY